MVFMPFSKKYIKRAAAKPAMSILILKAIAKFGYTGLDAFFPAKYPEARLWRKLLGLNDSYKFSKQTFSSILWRLQSQGLAAKSPKGWGITALGGDLIKKIKRAEDSNLSSEDGIMRLVIFDIPERERKKRIWLRIELTGYGYTLLQKSVWVGYRPLPQNFLEDLDYMNLMRCIHIFSISRAGTLEKI